MAEINIGGELVPKTMAKKVAKAEYVYDPNQGGKKQSEINAELYQELEGKAEKSDIVDAYTKQETDDAIGNAKDVLLFDSVVTSEIPAIAPVTQNEPDEIIYSSFYKKFVAIVGSGGFQMHFYAWPGYEKYVDTANNNAPYNSKVYLCGGKTYVWNGTDLVTGGSEQIQSDWNQSDSSKKDFIKNKPTLANVATSGSYNDLTDAPAIPAEQIQSDWNQSNSQAKDFIKNKPTIPTVPTNVSAFNNDAHYVDEQALSQAIEGKANKSEMTILEGAPGSPAEGKATITLKQGVSATVLTKHQDISGKADNISLQAEVTRATEAEENLRQFYNNLQQSQPIPVTQLPDTGEAGKIYRLAGATSYADYMYNENDLTTPIKMAEYDNAIDDEPTPGSDNLVKSGGIASWGEDNYGKYVENPEFVYVKTDAEGKILWAIKVDGNIYYGAGCPQQVKDYIEEKISSLSLDKYEDIVTFLSDYLGSDTTLKAMIDSINERIPEIIGNQEFVEVHLDAENKILYGVRKDGDFHFGAGIPSQIQRELDNKVAEVAANKVDKEEGKSLIDEEVSESLSAIEDPEGRNEITTDSEGKIISYRDSDGVKHENVGVKTGSATIDEVLINGGNATLDSATIDSLNLTSEGMTEFQQALKDAGFQPGGAGDWSDKNSMYIPEPRLAHLNIITNFNLTTLTKTSDVKCQVEFTDGAGNYFKKWIILNGQGRSSLQFMKKGLGADFFNEDPNSDDFDEDNVFSMKFGDWVYQDSFHIKSYYTDWPRCTSPVVYKLTDEVVKTRGVMNDRPYKKYYVGEYSDAASANTQSDLDKNMETGARCFPDGFPVIVYQNGEFWGVNAWQLKKHRDNYMLSKKKANHIHLDGDFLPYREGSTPFWLYDGTIDWSMYCSGTHGIETRNPKNLYCIDGKKYDADSHDAEIITTAIAEEWIAAGQIIPTGKTIDDTLAGYLRTTGKVRKNIEDLTRYIPDINRLISGETLIDGQQATTAQIKAAIEDRFDVNSFIDYILVNNVVGNTDAWSNNGQMVTWGKLSGSDNLNWSVNVYDCDVTFGCLFNGTSANAANSDKYLPSYPLYKIFWDYYLDDMKERYAELRNKGIFDADHITGLFRSWMNRVGYDNYKKEYAKWSESPCFRDGSQTYASNPTTGGFYGSIERIYYWIKKRIEYMDAASFFNYNS